MADLFYTDRKKLRRLEIARKVAFMMAWHPRLGLDAPIRRYVPKDVGKLIANRYMSTNTQITRSKKPLVLQKSSTEFALVIEKAQTQEIKNLWGRKKELSFFHFSVVGRALTLCEHFIVQTPVMRLPFTPAKDFRVEDVGYRHLFLQLLRPNEDHWFINLMENIDEAIVAGLFSTQADSLKHIRARYTSALKYDVLKVEGTNRHYPPKLKVRLPKEDLWGQIAVYDQRQTHLGSFRETFDQNMFEKGAEIRIIMRHVGVWKVGNGFFNQFMLEQVLLIRSAQKVKDDELAERNRFAFVLDDDEK